MLLVLRELINKYKLIDFLVLIGKNFVDIVSEAGYLHVAIML